MSYVLEALRRAQAERERGQVPGLHGQQPAVSDEAPPQRAPWPMWAAVAAGVVVLGGAGAWWVLSRPTAPAQGVVAASAPAVVAAAPNNANVPVTAPAPGASLPVVVSAPPAPLSARVPAPAASPSPAPIQANAPAAQTAQPNPNGAATPTAPATNTPTAPTSPSATAAPRTAAPTAARVSSSAPAPRAVRFADLTPEQRRELPPMVVGGSIWSDQRASRFIIVNGQVVREGDAAAPGVMLESLAPKAAYLRWRELLIELPL